jgi:hypothetical protein
MKDAAISRKWLFCARLLEGNYVMSVTEPVVADGLD